jgi:hypothetical protein
MAEQIMEKRWKLLIGAILAVYYSKLGVMVRTDSA